MGYYIKDNVLYINLDFNYEFSIDDIFDYIKKSKVLFKGTKIVLISSGIILSTLFLNPLKVSEYPNVQSIIQVIEPSKVETNNINLNNTEIDLPTESSNTIIENNDSKNETIIDKENVLITTEVNNEASSPISNNEVKEQEIVEENKAQETIITVYRSNGTVLNIELEEYLIGVVAAEMPASFNIEALKAQSIAARTYTLKSIENNKKLTDSISTQAYKDNSELLTMWGNDFDKYYEKVKSAVSSTEGIVIKYNGNLIDAVYHSTSNGFTESALNVWGNDIPYLQIVSSEWDLNASSYLRTTQKEFNIINDILGISLNDLSEITILEKDESNRIKSIKIDDQIFSGIELRTLLGLRSTDIEFEIKDNSIIFTTRGYGHGVGMSQYGANGMAKEGYTYDQILKHYYLGITLD